MKIGCTKFTHKHDLFQYSICIKTGIPAFLPSLYDPHIISSYTFTNYRPINQLNLKKVKVRFEKIMTLTLTLLSAGIHLTFFLSQLSTTFKTRVTIYVQLSQLSQLGGENGVCKITTQAQRVLLTKTSIPAFVPTLYDLPVQSYIIVQLPANYSIISIISKSKGRMNKIMT